VGVLVADELAEARAEIARLTEELADVQNTAAVRHGMLISCREMREEWRPIVEAATELANHRASDGGIALTSEHIARWERLVAAVEEGQKT
jgi:hypothetical protein